MANEGNSFWTTLPGVLTGIAGVLAAITGLYVATKSDPTSSPANAAVPATTQQSGAGTVAGEKPKAMMGPLQYGWNYDHHDINANGWLSIGSAEACADLCYERTDCKAMTYVVSNKSCWLKYSVPTPVQNPDMISASKQE